MKRNQTPTRGKGFPPAAPRGRQAAPAPRRSERAVNTLKASVLESRAAEKLAKPHPNHVLRERLPPASAWTMNDVTDGRSTRAAGRGPVAVRLRRSEQSRVDDALGKLNAMTRDGYTRSEIMRTALMQFCERIERERDVKAVVDEIAKWA
jgi:hypothetical protein